jgi:hypothetical protein
MPLASYLVAAAMGLAVLKALRNQVGVSDTPRRLLMAAMTVVLVSPAVVGHLHNLLILTFGFWIVSAILAIFGTVQFYADTAKVNLLIGGAIFLLAMLFDPLPPPK